MKKFSQHAEIFHHKFDLLLSHTLEIIQFSSSNRQKPQLIRLNFKLIQYLPLSYIRKSFSSHCHAFILQKKPKSLRENSSKYGCFRRVCKQVCFGVLVCMWLCVCVSLFGYLRLLFSKKFTRLEISSVQLLKII